MKNNYKKIISGVFIATSILLNTAGASNSTNLHLNVNDKNYYNKKDSNGAILTSIESKFDSAIATLLASIENKDLIFQDDISDTNDLDSYEELTFLGGPKTVDLNIYEKDNYKGRIYGKDRYETAIKAIKDTGKNIIVVSGENNIDILSAASLAKKENRNILLVRKRLYPWDNKIILKKYCEGKDIIFIGGEHSISRNVKKEILDITKNNGNIDKLTLSGDNRSLTSIEIAKRYKDIKSIVISDGDVDKSTIHSSLKASKLNSPLVISNSYDNLGIDTSKLNDIYDYNFKDVNEALEILETYKDKYNLLDLEANPLDETSLEDSNEENKVELNEVNSKEVEETGKNIITTDNGDIIDLDNKTVTFKDGQVRKYKKVMNLRSTSYDITVGTTTRTGTTVRKGVVAVDPNVIPLGTEMYITNDDDWHDYGYGRAEDTGGAIIGDIIDVFYMSPDVTYNYGRRNVTVYIFE